MNKFLLLLIFLLIYMCYKNSIIMEPYKYVSYDKKVCECIYGNGNENKKYDIIHNIVSKSFCKKMINSGEEYAKKYTWTKKRHDNYPTTDNEVDDTWLEYDVLKKIVKNKIAPKINEMYNVDINKIGINEIFIVKYDISGQRFLKYHEDGSEFSFIIGLNDSYSGGGTQFKNTKKTVHLGIGDCLVFSGQNRHRGRSINSGQRYILAGFLNYNGEEYCSKIVKN